MSGAFESSVNGVLNPDAVLECGVCWRSYDPSEGCESWDVPAGTAFADLPVEWRCPSCDASKDKFMVRDAGGTRRPAPRPTGVDQRIGDIVAAYRKAEKSMIGLPVHNPALEVEAVGFRPHKDGFAGVVVTPWCMNVTVVPGGPDAPPPGAVGSKRSHVFPSGAYTFTLGRLEGAGLIETCSLFSPMDDFGEQAVARAAAQAAADGLFEAPEPAPPPRMTRRFLLTRNGAPT